MGVSALGYVALNVSQPAKWVEFATGLFGMEVRKRAKGKALDLRIDERHHRFTLYPSKTDSVAALGWEVATMAGLESLAEALRAEGITVKAGSAELCEERKVRALYSFHEPHIGVATEICYGALVSNTPWAPSRGVSGYNTGSGLGLGHIVYWVKDMAATTAFYERVMGFSISDTIAWDDNDAIFLHCNPRHHSLALVAEAPGRPGGRLNHIMIEARTLDDVGYGFDIAKDMNIPMIFEMGKHTNDHMHSFYVVTPSGFGMEYGFGGRLISENWEIRHYDQPMLWGHRPPV